MPTTLEAAVEDSDIKLVPRYPAAGKEIDIGLEKAIPVYENGIIIASTLTAVSLPKGSSEKRL